MPFQRTWTGAPWEREVGYCRALRTGDRILVTGTASVDDDGNVHAPGDAEAQARRCFDLIEGALADLGAGMRHVVRTRMYVTDITQWRAIGRAHVERFADHPPVTTMVEVQALIHPDMLVEIEAEAVVVDAG